MAITLFGIKSSFDEGIKSWGALCCRGIEVVVERPETTLQRKKTSAFLKSSLIKKSNSLIFYDKAREMAMMIGPKI